MDRSAIWYKYWIVIILIIIIIVTTIIVIIIIIIFIFIFIILMITINTTELIVIPIFTISLLKTFKSQGLISYFAHFLRVNRKTVLEISMVVEMMHYKSGLVEWLNKTWCGTLNMLIRDGFTLAEWLILNKEPLSL